MKTGKLGTGKIVPGSGHRPLDGIRINKKKRPFPQSLRPRKGALRVMAVSEKGIGVRFERMVYGLCKRPTQCEQKFWICAKGTRCKVTAC